VEAVARAIEYVHSRGILHRNLNLENILVTPGGMPKVIGFGRARALRFEQAESKSPRESTATDIHALGAILYTSLTRSFSPLASLSQVPADVGEILLKCWQNDPAKQYQSAAEFADDLQRLEMRDGGTAQLPNYFPEYVILEELGR